MALGVELSYTFENVAEYDGVHHSKSFGAQLRYLEL